MSETPDSPATEAPATDLEVAPPAETQAEPSPGKPAAGGFHWGTGRRKSAVARVRLRDGAGKVFVNGKEFKVYFPNTQDQNQVLAPLQVTQMEGRIDMFVNVHGGGPSGQAGAVKMGLARALCNSDQNLESLLRGAGLMTRDSRMKERKKYGQRGARRRFQFSKR